MSKAAVRKNQADLLNQIKKDQKQFYAQRRQMASAIGSVNVGHVTTNAVGISTGDTNVPSSGLPTGGGTMIGPMAFKPNPITISGNKLTMANLLTTPTSWCIATGESSAADDLDYIITQNIGSDVGAWFEGQILILQAGVYNITLKHNTGNIFIPSGSDVTLNGYTSGGGGSGGDIAVLIFDNQVVDTSSGKWVLVSTSEGGVSLSGNNTWTGNNTFSGGTFASAATTSTSITSPAIYLGDATSDIINISGTVNFASNYTTDTPTDAAVGYILVNIGGASTRRLYYYPN